VSLLVPVLLWWNPFLFLLLLLPLVLMLAPLLQPVHRRHSPTHCLTVVVLLATHSIIAEGHVSS
jgi:hypothetical protein